MPNRTQRLRAKRRRPTARSTAAAADERRARLILPVRSGGVCEARADGRATDWAHRVAEGQGGLWCASNGLHLCRSCHAWCHANPIAARELGWMLRSTDDPEKYPVLHAVHGWVLLGVDGSFTLTDPPDGLASTSP